MPNKIRVNISVDKELKENSAKLFESFGLDFSTAISLFLSQSLREGKIPFEITKVEKKEVEHSDDYMQFLND